LTYIPFADWRSQHRPSQPHDNSCQFCQCHSQLTPLSTATPVGRAPTILPLRRLGPHSCVDPRLPCCAKATKYRHEEQLHSMATGLTLCLLTRSVRIVPHPTAHLCGGGQGAAQWTNQHLQQKFNSCAATVWGIARKWVCLRLNPSN
jgi:hypothetical protein